ncbi:hypothetical protein NESM_000512800 [Novymonas esmeraldas]|uniref:Uncharacterized protein n=1 Tax=Novymonas esmeraldas TaxID=1808958 RepID=A0AAW0EQR7_9TRYP
MFRLSHRFLRTPSIRFTYALAKSGARAPAPAAAAAAAASSGGGGGGAAATTAGPVQAILESFDALPKHLRPHVFDEVEMETVLMGGAAPYVPKHLQKKKK